MADKAKKILTIAEIDKLPLNERYSLYKENVVTPFKAIKNAQKRAGEGLHMAAKVHASLKREYTSLIAQAGAGKVIGTITAGTSEKEFFEKHCGGVPSGRVLAVSTFFNAMCMTLVDQQVLDKDGKPVFQADGKTPEVVKKSLLDETTQFDPHSGNSLEIAAACIGHERKASADVWMGTDNTLDVISAMSTPGDATTKLKEIRARQKGTKEEKSEGNAPHTIASCVAFLLEAIKNGGELLKVENGEEIVASLYADTFYNMGAAWTASGVPEETLQQWSSNIEKGVAPTMEVKTETETEAPAEAAPEPEAELAEA